MNENRIIQMNFEVPDAVILYSAMVFYCMAHDSFTDIDKPLADRAKALTLRLEALLPQPEQK